jgi:hypothetical protein
MSNCHCNSGINLDGSGQLGRYLKALDPTYAPIDDRSIEDLLLFAKRYAGQIRFYDIPENNINNGIKPEKVSWREFFRRDMAVIASSIAVLNITNIKKEYDEVRERLDEDPSQEKFKALFSITIGMAARMDRWYSVAIPENPLRTDLNLAINSHLRWQMKRMMAYEDGYKFIDSKKPLKLDFSGIENDEFWGLKDQVDADATIYEGSSPDDKLRNAALYADDIFNDFYSTLQGFIDKGPDYMTFALEQYPAHQPHMALFIAFLQIFKLAQEQMNGLTGRMLDFYYKEVLQLTPKDSIPDKTHVIFELAKDIAQYDIAAGTELSAGKDASGKEQVYKTATGFVVNQAKVAELKTIFIDKVAAKSPATGHLIQRIYANPVANSADGYGEPFIEANPKWPTFGKGEFNATSTNNICKQLDAVRQKTLAAPGVQTGFSIASPQLVLNGGKRLITLKMPGIGALLSGNQVSANNNPFEIWLTGEKEWLKVNKLMDEVDRNTFNLFSIDETGLFNPSDTTIETSYHFENDSIFVYLPVAETPVIAFHAKLHPGYNYQTAYPVIQVMLNPDFIINEEEYQKIKVAGLELEVRVGSINPEREVRSKLEEKLKIKIPDFHFDGLENVIIQTDEGQFKPGKGFNPFTAYPGKGKSLYIGSEEVFNKPLGGLAINIKRTQQEEEAFDDDKDGELKKAVEENNTILKSAAFMSKAVNNNGINRPYGVSVITNKNWKYLKDSKGFDFSQFSLTENILNQEVNKADGQTEIVPLILGRNPIEPVTEWQIQTNKGFVRIDWLIDFTRFNGNFNSMQISQEFAPALEVKELSVSYHSKLAALDSAVDQFFHVYPFGVVETYFSKADTKKTSIPAPKGGKNGFADLDKGKDYLLVDAAQLLFPQYNFLDSYSVSSNKLAAVSNNIRNKANALENLVRLSSAFAHPLEGGNNQYSGSIQEQGLLFIGLEKAVPLQSVSLLFQFAEGSAEDEDNDPPVIHWSYLTNNEWRPLRGEDVVSDGTYGFQTTGIVKLNLPADASNNNTIITKGLHWFAVSVSENAHRIPMLVNVVTQAVEVIFQDNGNDQSHFATSLPAGSISKLSVKVAQVSKVVQPFASFDGKHNEISKEFYTRVSERLRHKNRAINSWDYEHLVLDRFPSVYKVKCITATDPNCLCRNDYAGKHTRQVIKSFHFPGKMPETERDLLAAEINSALIGNEKLLLGVTIYLSEINEKTLRDFKQGLKKVFPGIDNSRFSIVGNATQAGDYADAELYLPRDVACCGPQIAPGHVLIVPIANLKNRNTINPLQPKTSRRVLLEIEAYLKKLTSPFVKVHAKNPVYEQVIVGFKVQFYTGTDKGFYLKKLNEEIVQYLTPWAFDENADVQFGQKIYASSIINFIEERPYVDFITDFLMGVCKDECCEEVKPETIAGRGNIEGKRPKIEDAVRFMESVEAASGENKKIPAPAPFTKVRGVVFDEIANVTLPFATVMVKGTKFQVTTSADGIFEIEMDPDTSVLLVQYVGYEPCEFAAAGEREFKIGMKPMPSDTTEVVVKDLGKSESLAEMFAGICGCEEIERQMGKDALTRGEIVARSSTARSILVSVPQHVIIPYTAPVKLSPCEKHKDHRATHPLSRTAPDNLPHSTFPTKEKTATPATPVSKTRKDALKEDKIKGTEEVKALKGNILAKKAKQIEPAGQIEKLVKKPGKTTSPRKPKPNGK